MKDQTLVTDKKYEGKWVAFASLTDHTVLAFGEDPAEVMEQARAAGSKEPVIVYIPKSEMAWVY